MAVFSNTVFKSTVYKTNPLAAFIDWLTPARRRGRR